jgi:hypothetical protein
LTRHPRASRSDAQLAARELLRIEILSTRWLLGDSPAGQKATADAIMTTLPRPTALYGRGFSFGATVSIDHHLGSRDTMATDHPRTALGSITNVGTNMGRDILQLSILNDIKA